MAEVLIDYDIELKGPDGRMYGAKACGRERDDGLWEGWIEFDPIGGGDPLGTDRETTQPNRDNLFYWATGITASYLDGALLRTLRQYPTLQPRSDPRARPSFDGPVPREHRAPAVAYSPSAVLDPFRAYAAGADVLRGQLNALSNDHLGNIVKAYGLSPANAAAVDGMEREELIALITSAVKARSTR